MSRTQAVYLSLMLAVSLIYAGWFFVQNRSQAQAVEDSHAEACDSCAARHQNLTRLREARSSSNTGDN